MDVNGKQSFNSILLYIMILLIFSMSLSDLISLSGFLSQW